MQMTFDITSISLRRVYLSIGKFCERCFAGCAIDLHGVVNFCVWAVKPLPAAEHVRAQRSQRRILNIDGNVIAKLCAPYTISV